MGLQDMVKFIKEYWIELCIVALFVVLGAIVIVGALYE